MRINGLGDNGRARWVRRGTQVSIEFDPDRALSTPGLDPPDVVALSLDNVAKCRSILPDGRVTHQH